MAAETGQRVRIRKERKKEEEGGERREERRDTAPKIYQIGQHTAMDLWNYFL